MRLRWLAAIAVLFVWAGNARADRLAGYTSGGGTNASAFFGQSFTATGQGSYSNIVFEFLNETTQSSFANGTAYLLTLAYSGSPNGLSASTPGELGLAVAANGAYSFAPGVILQAGRMYFLYTDKREPTASFTGGGFYSGGQDYLASSAGGSYDAGDVSSDFLVTGTTVTPEPATFQLLAGGCLGIAALARRRRA